MEVVESVHAVYVGMLEAEMYASMGVTYDLRYRSGMGVLDECFVDHGSYD